MAYGTINADVIQSSVPGVSLGAGNATVFKNRIINGDMRIDQRNAGASVTQNTTGTYCLDRWVIYGSVTSKFTAQQNAGSVTLPTGFINYLGATSSSAYTVGASETFVVQQFIEGLNCADLGWGTANAKTVTLSAWVYSSLTGTFGGSILNSAQNRSYPFSYTVSSANTWTSVSVTIAGDTSGTWLTTNGIGIRVTFSLGTGSTLSGTAGSWSGNQYFSASSATSVVGTSGATFYITGVQLEVGSSATGFEYVDYTTQLAMCQRYYQQVGGNTFNGNPAYPMISSGICYTTTQADMSFPFKVSMRTVPSFTQSTTAIQVGATLYPTTALSDAGSTQNVAFIRVSTAGVFVAGNGANFIGNNSTASYIAFSAEL